MVNRLLCLLLAAISTTSILCVRGQVSPGIMDREISGFIVDSATLQPLPMAVVVMHYEGRIKSLTTDEEGEFHWKFSFPVINLSLEISYLGYKIYRKKIINVDERLRLGNILMSPDSIRINEIEVKARQSMFGQRGDTLLIIPKGVGYTQGATLLDVLKNTHGVNISGDKVMIGNRTIERAYVNDKLTFGKDPLNPMKYINASQTSLVKVYDEDSPGIKSEEAKQNNGKRRVINILTFDNIEYSLQANVVGSLGADIDKNIDEEHKTRYLYGVGVRFFCEQRQLLADFVDNNINSNVLSIDGVKPSIGGADSHNSNLSVVYADKLKGKNDIKLTYKNENINTTNKSYNQQIYFPTDLYRSHISADTSTNILESRIHSINIKTDRESGQNALFLSGDLDLSETKDNQQLFTQTSVDDKLLNKQYTHDYSKGNAYNINLDATWLYKLKFAELGVNAGYNVSNDDTKGWREDASEINSTVNKVLKSGSGRGTTANVSISLSQISLKKSGKIDVSYALNYVNNKTKEIAYDTFSGIIDTTLTRDFTNNYVSNELDVRYDVKLWKKIDVTVKLAYNLKRNNIDDRFPVNNNAKKSFNALLPSLSVKRKLGQFSLLNFNYNTSVVAPSMEALLGKLDISNVLMIRGGNPNLKQRYTHSLSLFYAGFMPEKSISYDISLLAGIIQNSIVSRSNFFVDSTYLPQYNYIALPGASLMTLENANGAKFLRFSAKFGSVISGWQYSVGANYNYNASPMYVKDKLIMNVRHQQAISIGLRRMLYKDIEFKLSASSGYALDKSHNNKTQKAINENASAEFDIQLGRLFVRPNYNFTYYHSFNNELSRNSNHILNTTIGCRLFKEYSGEVSISAFDILNSNKGFESLINAESVSNQWRQMTSRFITLNFIYKFKHNK